MMKHFAYSIRVLLAALATTFLAQSAALAAEIVSSPAQDFRALMRVRQELAQKDRQAMMEQLGIRTPGPFPPAAEDPKRPAQVQPREGSNNWYDEAGNTHVRSGWGNWSNYDESKAGTSASPSALVLKNGQPVRDARAWWDQRRPEILADFENHVYGKTPRQTPAITFKVTETIADALDGRARMKSVIGEIDNSMYPEAAPQIEFVLYTPANARGPVPVIVQATGFFGRFRPGRDGFGRPRGPNTPPSPLEQCLDQGWGFALMNTAVVQMDSGAGLREGIIGLMNRGQPRNPTDWGVLAAWAWGLSRVIDYCETDTDTDARRMGVQGHSRWGKAALLAAALDSRWAVVFPSCSGAMGASLEKRNWGETIDNVCGTSEYHWMAGNFLKYGGNWDAMPTDAHLLIALVAPRPAFITGGTRDQWADPHGQFLACLGADPVYRLLGKNGLATTTMPDPDVALVSGELAFRNHDGGHFDIPDWPIFIKFAKRYLDTPRD